MRESTKLGLLTGAVILSWVAALTVYSVLQAYAVGIGFLFAIFAGGIS